MKFGSHPLNLILRFILEISTFIATGYWGYLLQDNFSKYIFALLFPIILATLWGVFAVPNDPSRSGKTVVKTPGVIRLFLELGIFSVGTFCIYQINYPTSAFLFSFVVIFHYVISFDRITWLFQQK